MFLKILQILHESTCVGVSFLQTPTQVLSCEIWESMKNNYFEEDLNDCFCVLITLSYIDFYNPLLYKIFIFTDNFLFIVHLEQ